MATEEKTPDVDVVKSDDAANKITKTRTVDTVHNDESLQVLANYHGDPNWDEAEEDKLRRKVDWKLLPVLCITYGLQYYDKAMLSQAVCTFFRSPRDVRVLTMLTTCRHCSV